MSYSAQVYNMIQDLGYLSINMGVKLGLDSHGPGTQMVGCTSDARVAVYGDWVVSSFDIDQQLLNHHNQTQCLSKGWLKWLIFHKCKGTGKDYSLLVHLHTYISK